MLIPMNLSLNRYSMLQESLLLLLEALWFKFLEPTDSTGAVGVMTYEHRVNGIQIRSTRPLTISGTSRAWISAEIHRQLQPLCKPSIGTILGIIRNNGVYDIIIISLVMMIAGLPLAALSNTYKRVASAHLIVPRSFLLLLNQFKSHGSALPIADL